MFHLLLQNGCSRFLGKAGIGICANVYIKLGYWGLLLPDFINAYTSQRNKIEVEKKHNSNKKLIVLSFLCWVLLCFTFITPIIYGGLYSCKVSISQQSWNYGTI